LAKAVGAFAEGDGRWRRVLVSEVDPRNCDVILDMRCGHGALTVALAEAAPDAIVMGLDHREDALERARARAELANTKINLIHGHARDIASYVNELRPTRIVCTLSTDDDPAERRAILAAARRALAPRGTLHIVEPAGATPRLLTQLLGPALQSASGSLNATMDMMRQTGFVGVMDIGLYAGQATAVRITRGATP
jgi:ubiquinone/menaquinone biosynthesis C-methylase UbiE